MSDKMQNALKYDKSLEIEKLNIKRRECMGEIMKVLEIKIRT